MLSKLNNTDLKSFLDEKYKQYNNYKFIKSDPIQVPHSFSLKEDIEISAFLTSTISWGNRKVIIKNAKKMNKKVFTKSGIMVGLGETRDEILQVMDDLKSADVDFLTIGQYLQPSVKHFPLERYYTPDEFKDLGDIAKSKGFLLVSSSPLTRSSYHADEDFAKLQQNRINSH